MPDIKLDSDELIKPTWKDSIYRQREELARMLGSSLEKVDTRWLVAR